MHSTSLRVTLLAVVLAMAPVAWSKDKKRDAADSYPSEVASKWFDTLYDVVKSEGTSPPPASRIYGVTAVSLYESIVSGTEEHRSLVGQLNGLRRLPRPQKGAKYHWPTVANAALARTIRGIFTSLKAENLAAVNAIEADFDERFEAEVKQKVFQRSVAHGHMVADAVLGWCGTDGFGNLNNCPYVPASVAGAWEPTYPLYNPNPLQPCWGQIRPMVRASGAACRPAGHPEFSTDFGSDFYAAGLEVYNIGRNLTAEQKTIARYWADGPGATGTPPGHWIAIVGQIARKRALSLAAAAEAYARVGIAVHDAFIQCWNAKYLTNGQRPETYIQHTIDAGWLPYLVTPNFPTYTSGHSTQSGAAATVLTDMFGTKAFTDTTHTDHGLLPPQAPRAFGSFDKAADEAALSRLFGGIHFAFDNDDGLASGRCIGRTILRKVSFKECDDRDDEECDDGEDDDDDDGDGDD